MDRMEILHRLIDVLTYKARYQQESCGLNPGDMQLLERLGLNEGVPTLVLARRCGIPPATAVAALDRLQAKGHVTRQRDERDRRVVGVALTDTGRALLAQHLSEDRAFAANLFGALAPAECAQLLALLDKMLRAVAYDSLFAEHPSPSAPHGGQEDSTRPPVKEHSE